ncbi:hypothetical protein ACCS63_35140, partial [Rhizobium brockwellii]|uniref:hypothetical protein n=1 Tax=Rhizobium brockwellii TaxID=3019932 RepID=UPI003F946FD5
DRSVITDPDMAEAVAAIVDGEGGEAVAARLNLARAARVERHVATADVWTGAAEIAPATGGPVLGIAVWEGRALEILDPLAFFLDSGVVDTGPVAPLCLLD